MQGKIIKGIAGFYYVYVEGEGLFCCKAKGVFRNQNQKPLVGDRVDIEVIDPEEKTGTVSRILPRTNQLLRPEVANIDQALVIFAAAKPMPNFHLLDRFLIMMEKRHIPVVICLNKRDLVTEGELQQMKKPYELAGYPVISSDTCSLEGVAQIEQVLQGKTTALAGPSGVGKSSILNRFVPDANMETGDISKKLKRGKHTTRHSELFRVKEQTFLMDTPGFTSLMVDAVTKEELPLYYREFKAYEPHCRFQGCMHQSEPDCGVKEAVERGKISSLRYENYCQMLQEIKEQKRYGGKGK